MTIQENISGLWGGVDEWLSVTNLDNTSLEWETESGTSPYLATADDDDATHSGSHIHEDKTDGEIEGWFNFSDTVATGAGFTVNFTFRMSADDGAANDGFDLWYDTTGAHATGTQGDWVQAQGTTYAYTTVTLGDPYTATEINNMRIRLITHTSAPGDDIYV